MGGKNKNRTVVSPTGDVLRSSYHVENRLDGDGIVDTIAR